MKRTVRHTLNLGLSALFLTLFLMLGTTWAHEGEEGADLTAKELARQAVAFLVNEPPNPEMALERLNDAVADDEVEGVDVATLSLAAGALEAGAPQAVPPLVAAALGETTAVESGPVVAVQLGAGVYWAFAAGLLLAALGAYGLGRRSRPAARTAA